MISLYYLSARARACMIASRVYISLFYVD